MEAVSRATTLTTRPSIGAVPVMAGYATPFQTRGSARASPFLENPSRLHGGASGEAKLVYVNPGADFRTHRKIQLDPVVFAAGNARVNLFAAMSEDDQQAVANYPAGK